MYLTNDGKILLNDWSASTKLDDATREPGDWQGTADFSVTSDDQTKNKWSDATCDLVAVIRSAYVLLFNMKSNCLRDGAYLRKGTLWQVALTHATNQDYDNLAKLLYNIK